MTEIYCGNNHIDTDLLNGTKVLGNRYKCMRKGIGTGMNLPHDPKMAEPYIPIDKTKIYCGLKRRLPNGYDRFGSLAQCLQKGVGIGKKITAEKIRSEENDNRSYSPIQLKKNTRYISYIFVGICLFILLYILKPSCVTEKNTENNTVRIVWKKFILHYFISYILVLLILTLF